VQQQQQNQYQLPYWRMHRWLQRYQLLLLVVVGMRQLVVVVLTWLWRQIIRWMGLC
jgi:hypothetical protein